MDIMAGEILTKLNSLDKKLNSVERVEEQLEKLVDKEEGDLKKVEKDETKIEKSILKIGSLTIKRSHFLELARGTAGAFLGVGLGQALGGSVSTAQRLGWINVFGILFFILILVSILIYRNDRDQIKNKQSTLSYVIKKLVYLYVVSLSVQLLGLALFNNFPGWNAILAKALIIGSYSSMSSAVAFTLI